MSHHISGNSDLAELKEELNNLGIDYAEEIRDHLEKMVKRDKLRKVMKEVDGFRRKLGKKTGRTSSPSETISEDRERGH